MLRARCHDYRYPPHSHETYVVAAFKDGAQRHRIAREHGIAYPGMVMIIPPGEVHTRQSAERDLGWSYCAFYPSASSLQEMSDDLFGPTRGSLDFGTSFLIEDRQLASQLLEASAVSFRSSQDTLLRQQAVYSVFDLLITRYGRRGSIRESRNVSLPPIKKALDFIHAKFCEPLKVDQIADVAGLSEYHFMRVFKAQIHVTVYQYLNHLRLESAKQLLARGQTAASVASSVGFYDQSHFTRSFRRAFGTTPSRYIKACR